MDNLTAKLDSKTSQNGYSQAFCSGPAKSRIWRFLCSETGSERCYGTKKEQIQWLEFVAWFWEKLLHLRHPRKSYHLHLSPTQFAVISHEELQFPRIKKSMLEYQLSSQAPANPPPPPLRIQQKIKLYYLSKLYQIMQNPVSD